MQKIGLESTKPNIIREPAKVINTHMKDRAHPKNYQNNQIQTKVSDDPLEEILLYLKSIITL